MNPWRLLNGLALASVVAAGLSGGPFFASVVLGVWFVPIGAATLGGARSAPPALALFGGSVAIPLTLLATAQIPALQARVAFAWLALACWVICVAAGLLLRHRPRLCGAVIAGGAAAGGLAAVGYFNDWFPLLPAGLWLPGAAASAFAPEQGKLTRLPGELILGSVALVLSVGVVIGSLGRPVLVQTQTEAVAVRLGWPLPFVVQDKSQFASLLSFPRYSGLANPGEYPTRVAWPEFAIDIGTLFAALFLGLGGAMKIALVVLRRVRDRSG